MHKKFNNKYRLRITVDFIHAKQKGFSIDFDVKLHGLFWEEKTEENHYILKHSNYLI